MKKNTKKNDLIQKDEIPFKKTLQSYLKHRGLEIELQLKNGEQITIDNNLFQVNEHFIELYHQGEIKSITFNDISSADIYAY